MTDTLISGPHIDLAEDIVGMGLVVENTIFSEGDYMVYKGKNEAGQHVHWALRHQLATSAMEASVTVSEQNLDEMAQHVDRLVGITEETN